MVDLNLEFADIKRSENLADDGEHLGIRDHERIITCNVKVALVELSEPAFVHLWLVSPIDLGHVESLDLLDPLCGHVPGEGHRKVVTECK